MKKIMIMLAVVAAAVVANAASFNWQAANLYGSDGTTKYAGTVNLYAVIDGVDTLVSSATAAAGAVKKDATKFSNDSLKGGNTYDFYITYEDNGKLFTSALKEDITAQATVTSTVNFGNMATQTQNASNWATVPSGDVPEPTSGLLLLLGVAGLALRRKQK